MTAKAPAGLVDHDVERALIGSVLADPPRYAEVSDLLPGVFGDPAHRGVWKAVRATVAAGMAIDQITVGARTTLQSEQEALRACAAAWTADTPLVDYARLLGELAQRRALLAGAQNLARFAQDRDAAWQDVRDGAERMIVRTLQEATDAPAAEELVAVFRRAMAEMREQATGKADVGILMGLRGLDAITGGMRRREITILAGKTGKGKSSLGWQAALAAVMAGHEGIGFSLEMESTMLARRMMAAEVQHDSRYLHQRLGLVGARLESFTAMLKERAWFGLHEQPGLTISDIRSRIRVARAEHPHLAFVVVDYLQLVRPPPGRYHSREREVAMVSEGLKEIAKELNLAVLALSQFSRKIDEEHRRPRASDLRDSGAVEQDAALVLALHDPDPKGTPKPEVPYELCVLKNRHGPVGNVLDLIFHPSWTSFEEGTLPADVAEAPAPRSKRGRAPPRHLFEAKEPVDAREREPGEEG